MEKQIQKKKKRVKQIVKMKQKPNKKKKNGIYGLE